MKVNSLEFRVRLEYSFETGLKLLLIDPYSGEIISSSISAGGLLHDLNDYLNKIIFSNLNAF